MKNQFKKVLKLSLILTLLVMAGCERDLYEESIKQNESGKVRLLNLKERAEIADKLTTILKDSHHTLTLSTDSQNKISMDSIGTIKYDEVMQIVNNGVSTYTFKVDNPNSSISKFFNLVLEEKASGNVVKLLEYTMTPEFAQEFSQTLNYKDFKGTVSTYTIVNETPCPDDDLIVVDVGQVGGNPSGGDPGPGNNNGPDGNGPGGYNPDAGGIVIIIVVSNPSYEDDWLDVSQSPRYFKMSIKEPIDIDPIEEEPCNKETHIGILTPYTDCEKEFMLSSQNRIWLYQNQSSQLYSEIMEYINGEGSGECSTEKNQFMNEVVQQLASNPGVFTSIKPLLIEKQIDDSQLDDCTKAILNKLKQNHTIAKIISRFQNPNIVFGLNFSQVPNLVNQQGNPLYGHTFGTSNNYNIQLNSNYFNNDGATNLGKATTILHEIIHALIDSVIDNIENPNNNDINDFNAIWDAWVNHNTGNTNDSAHVIMGNHYVMLMASALQEYGTGEPVDSSSQLLPIYKDLAWSGIWTNGNTNFDTFLTNNDKAGIHNRKKTEMEKTTNYGMEPSSNNPCIP